jgi:hypothetical protein
MYYHIFHRKETRRRRSVFCEEPNPSRNLILEETDRSVYVLHGDQVKRQCEVATDDICVVCRGRVESYTTHTLSAW